MNTTARRAILLATAVVGLDVGGWALVAPGSFYASFPGLGMIWVAVHGPYDEHLVRDVGALYLGLVDVVGQVVSLSLTVVLAVLLLLPARHRTERIQP